MPTSASLLSQNSLIILSAVALDLAVGDPRWFPHPVRAIGLLIRNGEALFRRFGKHPRTEKAAGLALAIVILAAVYVLSRAAIIAAFNLSAFAGFFVSAVMAYTTLAARDLGRHARNVLARLQAVDLPGARTELSLIVGRDTAELQEPEICRAVVETVAENSSDGVVAPLFFMVIGGPALAMAYKAVNTMDSMLGIRTSGTSISAGLRRAWTTSRIIFRPGSRAF